MTINRDGMTRIGFAYNQKPEPTVGLVAVDQLDTPRSDEEPPSTRRDTPSRNSHHPAPARSGARGLDVAMSTAVDRPAAGPIDEVYAEWDSPETIDAVANALAGCGEVIRLEADADFPERLRAERPDIVFNIAEGLHGANREAHVPAICEFLDVPYSGSDPFTLSLCLHKARTKELLSFHGIPTAPFTLLASPADLDALMSRINPRLPLPTTYRPLFLKPVQEGSSKGITEKNVVHSADELEAQALALLETYRQPVLAEAFLPGAEFTCGVVGNGAGARVLPLVGMNFGSLPQGALPIYGFEAKWVWDTRDEPLEIFECPARVDARLRGAIERVVLRTYDVLGCRDWARVDVRLDAQGIPNVVEVNPLPGILPNPQDNSCLPKAARAAGMSYDDLIQSCLRAAAARYALPLALEAVA